MIICTHFRKVQLQLWRIHNILMTNVQFRRFPFPRFPHFQILRSVDRKYFKKNQYMESHASEGAEPEKKEEGWVYNPMEYTFENILKILLSKMSVSGRLSHA